MSKKHKSILSSATQSSMFRLMLVVSCLVVLTLLSSLLVTTESSNSNVKQYGSSGPASGSYEIISTVKNGETTRITVVTSLKSDEELTALNDKLFLEKKNESKSVFIDYFDDREAAKDYFTVIGNASVSNEQKKQLTSRYVAVMSATPTLPKSLYRVQGEAKLLKSY